MFNTLLVHIFELVCWAMSFFASVALIILSNKNRKFIGKYMEITNDRMSILEMGMRRVQHDLHIAKHKINLLEEKIKELS